MKEKTHLHPNVVVLAIAIIAFGLSIVSLANLYIIHKYNQYAFENHSEINYQDIAEAQQAIASCASTKKYIDRTNFVIDSIFNTSINHKKQ